MLLRGKYKFLKSIKEVVLLCKHNLTPNPCIYFQQDMAFSFLPLRASGASRETRIKGVYPQVTYCLHFVIGKNILFGRQIMKYNLSLDKPDKNPSFYLPALNYISVSLTHPSLKVQLLRHVKNASIIKSKDSDSQEYTELKLGVRCNCVWNPPTIHISCVTLGKPLYLSVLHLMKLTTVPCYVDVGVAGFWGWIVPLLGSYFNWVHWAGQQ